MNKRTNKKKNYHKLIIDRIKEKYGVSQRFITMSLNGDRNSDTSDTIRSEYPSMEKKVIEFLKGL